MFVYAFAFNHSWTGTHCLKAVVRSESNYSRLARCVRQDEEIISLFVRLMYQIHELLQRSQLETVWKSAIAWDLFHDTLR
jgi:hypothetical protein